jgi:hypothetical protein
MANYGLGNSNAVEDVFSDPRSNVSSFNSLERRAAETNETTDSIIAYSNTISQISIKDFRSYIFQTESIVKQLLEEIESNLHLVNINPYISSELDVAHTAVWKDAEKYINKTSPGEFRATVVTPMPEFICYEEYLYCLRHQCRSCRELIKQYELNLSQSSFGYLLSIKKTLNYLYSEILIVKNISIYYLGEVYKDETEAEIAKHLSNWAKTITHYTKQLAKEITANPVSLPQSELDQISKKQAAQFQAFFSIRINSLTSEINSVINLIKRDSVDTSEIFYNNFLLPALTFKSKLVEPIMLDINTTPLGRLAPTLVGEMVVASNAIVGNLGSLTADLVERRITSGKRLSAVVEQIRTKRRYVGYMIQLEEFGKQRQVTLANPDQQDVKKYSEIFQSIVVDSSKRENLRSSHNDLDDIDGDAHPQYLRIDGGTIYGKIEMAEGATIGGIDIANHTHNLEDGSFPISASSIDYTSAREEYYDTIENRPYSNLNVVDFEAIQKIGGGHEYNVSFQIEIEDEKLNTYDFEILYKEI